MPAADLEGGRSARVALQEDVVVRRPKICGSPLCTVGRTSMSRERHVLPSRCPHRARSQTCTAVACHGIRRFARPTESGYGLVRRSPSYRCANRALLLSSWCRFIFVLLSSQPDGNRCTYITVAVLGKTGEKKRNPLVSRQRGGRRFPRRTFVASRSPGSRLSCIFFFCFLRASACTLNHF